MRDHELELIAALVEGRLEDESEARALIASSPELEDEYLAQKTVYEALRSAPPVALSDTEKAALHRDVWTGLRAGRPAATPTRAPWYYRWVPVAAGMFVIVGIVAVINQGGADSNAGQEAAGLTATTSAATDSATGGPAGGDGSTRGLTGEIEDGDSGTEDTSTPSSETIPGDGEATIPPVDADLTSSELAFYQAEADEVRKGDLSGVELEGYDNEATLADLVSCIAESGLTGFEMVGARSAEILEDELRQLQAASGIELPADLEALAAAIPAGADLDHAVVAFVDLVDCRLIFADD
jgi:hypothetical protein